MSATFKLGIQSYCFRKFIPIPELIRALEQAGLSYVEIWPKHLPWDEEKAEQEKALSALRDKGITMSSYGQVRFSNDEGQARAVLAFARETGIKAVTSDVDEDAFPLMERLSEEFGINIAVHNHGRNHRYGHFDQLKEVFSKTSLRFGLCLDTGWFLDAGCEPLEATQLFKDRIYGVHLKDFVFDDQGKPQDVILGTGGLDLPEFMKRLKNIDFSGYLSIEYEGDADNPVPKVKECVKVVEEVIDAL